VALLFYVFVRVAALAGRSDVKRLADGRCVPTLVPDNVFLSGQVQTEFTKAVDNATREIGGSGRGGGGNRGGDDPSARIGDAVGGRRPFLAPVSALLHGLCHAKYDPRPTTGGEQTKAQVDISWVMPFLALLYTRTSSMSSRSGQCSSPTPVFMDAGGAQHLASALLFGIRAVNALVFFQARRPATPAGSAPQQRRRTLAAAFSNIADVSDPSDTTAAAYVVMFRSLSEAIARSEVVGPGTLPCDDPSRLHGAPLRAVCGMLLDRAFHMSTLKLGGLASELQARLWRMFQELTWGYQPPGSSIFTEPVHLVDQPSVHTPGVSFLQLPANRRRVAGWQAHMRATGVLDDAAGPVGHRGSHLQDDASRHPRADRRRDHRGGLFGLLGGGLRTPNDGAVRRTAPSFALRSSKGFSHSPGSPTGTPRRIIRRQMAK